MNVEWIRGKSPVEERQYLVKIEMSSYHFEFPSIRRWKEGQWQLTGAGEQVVAFLEGLEL